uniref:Uncharacterized protein n=1 Tax=Glossina pallidipes TaxID=7398 RepID=A0A1A9ZT90_GLOPL
MLLLSLCHKANECAPKGRFNQREILCNYNSQLHRLGTNNNSQNWQRGSEILDQDFINQHHLMIDLSVRNSKQEAIEEVTAYCMYRNFLKVIIVSKPQMVHVCNCCLKEVR